jgi:hypothetical protein
MAELSNDARALLDALLTSPERETIIRALYAQLYPRQPKTETRGSKPDSLLHTNGNTLALYRLMKQTGLGRNRAAEEIARRVGIPAGTLRKIWTKAKKWRGEQGEIRITLTAKQQKQFREELGPDIYASGALNLFLRDLEG